MKNSSIAVITDIKFRRELSFRVIVFCMKMYESIGDSKQTNPTDENLYFRALLWTLSNSSGLTAAHHQRK